MKRYVYMGTILAGYAVLNTSHGSHHVVRGSLSVVEKELAFQRLEAIPVRSFRAQLMCQVYPFVTCPFYFFHKIPQFKVCHNIILL